MVSALGAPVEQTKYPSEQKVVSFQKCFFKNGLCFCYIRKQLSCLMRWAISPAEGCGSMSRRKCRWSLSDCMVSMHQSLPAQTSKTICCISSFRLPISNSLPYFTKKTKCSLIKNFALKKRVSGTDTKTRNELPALVGVLTSEAYRL